MAKLGDLVVNIGANTKDLNRQLGHVQRKMRSMGSNFKKLGQSMTKSLTLPILAIGGMALKSASDLETLETSFISLTGGAKQAADMMKQLNDFTAKTPFQIDAVATSARQLIASGTELSEVNSTLQFLGDIAATSGKPINELASIFAKVNAKGKVELESLNQLAERGIPVFKGLAKATGKLPSELGAGGVTVKQFNDYLRSLSEEGGMAHGAMKRLSETASGKFSTALDNLKLAGAALGNEFLPIIKEILDEVVVLAQKFGGLSDSTKKNILIVGGLVAALGPLLTILPGLTIAVSGLGGAIAVMGGSVGIAVAGIAALSFALYKIAVPKKELLSLDTKATIQAQKQSAKVRFLVDQYGKEGTKLKDRKKILKNLKDVDEKHFGNLDTTKTSLEELTVATNNYVSSLRDQARESAILSQQETKIAEIADIEAQIIEAKETIFNLREEFNEPMLGDFNWGVENIGFFDVSLQNAQYTVQNLNEKIRRLGGENKGLIHDLENFRDRYDDIFNKVGENSDTVSEDVESSGEVIVNTITDIEEKLISLSQISTPVWRTLSNGVQEFAVNSSTSLLAFLNDFKNVAEEIQEPIKETVNNTITAFDNLGQQIGDVFASAIVDGENFVDSLVSMGKSILKTLISEAIAHAITNAASSKNVVNQASGGLTIPAFIAAAVGSVKGAFSNIPQLAEGGIAFGPSLVEVGEYSGAGGNPEVIAPLNKLKDMIGGNAIQVYGRISGDDIVISNNRATRDRNRF